MRLRSTAACVAIACLSVSLSAASASARREPRRSFEPVRYLTDARVDWQFRVGPPPPTRDEQLRPLPSFYAAPGSQGSDGRGLHDSIWQRIRHYDWAMQQRAREAETPLSVVHSPRTILLIRRTPSAASTVPTTRRADRGPIIESITIR